ncbi:MAG TPA: type II secretion system protein GspK [Geminicoccaceae bacterium]|nr:type II secretion system protein GspK [Geminicoccaceae bacterium]
MAVLWFTVAMAGMAAAFATLARGEALRSRNMVDGIRARAILEASLDRAALELVSPTVQPTLRGVEIEWPFDGALVHIVVTGESGLVDLNSTSPELMAALARELGADRDLAQRVADAVLDWRDENSLRRPKGAEDRDYRSAGRQGGAADAQFGHVGELRQLLPVEPALYRKLRDLVTVATGRGNPDSELAPEPVRRALLGRAASGDRDRSSGDDEGDTPNPDGTYEEPDENDPESEIVDDPDLKPEGDEQDPSETGFTDPAGVYAVRLDAVLRSGYRAHADAVIWVQETSGGRPFRVLDWDPSPWRASESR